MPAAHQDRLVANLRSFDVLRIAQLDAERAYRSDMKEYYVMLAFRPDGWHVDYDLTDTRLHGGGPHYVIDPTTGEIRHKRYEQ
jgi:hypothetical protein